MKEYWVNAYEHSLSKLIWYGNKFKNKTTYLDDLNIQYRLHIREFETKEAKELYLKMKYGREIKYNKHWNVMSPKYIASRKYANWMGP